MTWTTEQIELLKTHFHAGLSCGQIARRIGMSRNAVIGKLNRLGLSRPRNVIARQLEQKAAAGAHHPRSSQRSLLMAIRTELRARSDEAPIPADPRCSLLDLTAAKCRWPIGDPGSKSFGFCGNEQVRGFSYCAAHARMAYGRRPARAANGG